MKTSTDVAVLENKNLAAELEKLGGAIVAGQVEKMKPYLDLRIAGINDKEGYKNIHSALRVIKRQRIKIEKTRKELKADALAYRRAVDSKAKELQALIEPIESHLSGERDRIDSEKKEIERRKKVEAGIAACWKEAHDANLKFDRRKGAEERLRIQAEQQAQREEELRLKEMEIARKSARENRKGHGIKNVSPPRYTYISGFADYLLQVHDNDPDIEDLTSDYVHKFCKEFLDARGKRWPPSYAAVVGFLREKRGFTNLQVLTDDERPS